MVNYVQRVLNPAWYHGHGAKPPYFEGWYFKVVNADETQRWAFIPGVHINEDKQKTHTFIQVLNGSTAESYYHVLPTFEAQENTFDVRLEDNYFREDRILFNLDDEIGAISGELTFHNLKPWPINITSPGYMGRFAWLPFLETYHGVLSFDHEIQGSLNLYGVNVDFTGGRGYIEKDWGKAFPDGYIWQQSNHFDTVGTSFTGSIAVVPNIGRTFTGFGIGLWHEGQLLSFTTYNGAKIDTVEVSHDSVTWAIYNRDYELRVVTERAEGGLLKGPEREDMLKRVDETMKATMKVEVYELFGPRKSLIFKETGRNAGLEVVGDMTRILTA